jgi:hypothetical protein
MASVIRQTFAKFLNRQARASLHMELLDAMKRDHDEIEVLLSRLRGAEGTLEHRALVKQIKVALRPHFRAVERVGYAAAVALKDEKAQANGHEAYLEHQWIGKALHCLQSIDDVRSPGHRAIAKVLQELIGQHMQEDENFTMWRTISVMTSTETA